jgi:sugar phosphate isomerase/epimerase
MVKIGSPLFILREEAQRDLFRVLERLAEIGFEGVEFLGFFGNKAAAVRAMLNSLGLTAIGNHVPFDEFSRETGRVIDEHKEIGCGYITIGALEQDGLPGSAGYPRTIENITRIGEAVSAAGMKLLFHNHAEELQKVNGKTILSHLLDDTPDNHLYLEADLGWMQIGGANPLEYLRRYKNRCPVLHFKDYLPYGNEQGFIFRPTGYGVMDNAGLYVAALALDPPPQWIITDHDCAYERDIYSDLQLSFQYMENLMEL